MAKLPMPEELVDDWQGMFVTVLKFTHHAKATEMPPAICYALIVACFMNQFKKEDLELVRDIAAKGTNLALQTFQTKDE